MEHKVNAKWTCLLRSEISLLKLLHRFRLNVVLVVYISICLGNAVLADIGPL
jgi:hypothetical protein